MTREQVASLGREYEKLGWKFFQIGKKPLHSYSAELDGVVVKGASMNALVTNIRGHLNSEKAIMS